MILAFAVTQLLDGASAILMTSRGELNPGARLLLDQPGFALAMKVALIVMVASISIVVARTHRRVGQVVLAVGIVAGIVGALSNIAVIRALAEGA